MCEYKMWSKLKTMKEIFENNRFFFFCNNTKYWNIEDFAWIWFSSFFFWCGCRHNVRVHKECRLASPTFLSFSSELSYIFCESELFLVVFVRAILWCVQSKRFNIFYRIVRTTFIDTQSGNNDWSKFPTIESDAHTCRTMVTFWKGGKFVNSSPISLRLNTKQWKIACMKYEFEYVLYCQKWKE